MAILYNTIINIANQTTGTSLLWYIIEHIFYCARCDCILYSVSLKNSKEPTLLRLVFYNIHIGNQMISSIKYALK